jgi:O-succinylbenzoate synthase
MQSVEFEFRPYCRPFYQPLHTNHGLWKERQGILLRLRNQAGTLQYGEIAPLPWFGTETLAQAVEFCQQLPPKLTLAEIAQIPDRLPSCQFGFESAWSQSSDQGAGDELPISLDHASALLPTGAQALETWRSLWQQGYRTFKWKIGVAEISTELGWLQQLVDALPATARLRLDANGGLTQRAAAQWLQHCDRIPMIEYLEQPLAPTQFAQMLELSQTFRTAIALDESVTTLPKLQSCYAQGWRGVYVIKPAIAGFPSRLHRFCQTHPIDAVFSSVFETAIARQAGLALAAKLANPHRALGYGTKHWFADGDRQISEELWQNL